MTRPHLIIICGVPGAGKSTFSLRAVDKWGAVGFASETFASQLGAAARIASGDLSKEAIAHAYSAMGSAVAAALAKKALVVSVGSFRAGHQRNHFREIAGQAGAGATTIRIACPVKTAAERVRARIAQGEHGPTEGSIRRIESELDRADDVDLVVRNDSSVERYHQRIDAVMKAL